METILHALANNVPHLLDGRISATNEKGSNHRLHRPGWLLLDRVASCQREAHTVREFVELAFASADLDWQHYVEVDPRYFRPAEVDYLCADASKARTVLDWEPTVTFIELVRIIVEADIKELEARFKGGKEALQHAGAADGRDP